MYYLKVIFEVGLIVSFADRRSQVFFQQEGCPAEWQAIRAVLVRKLTQMHAATHVAELASPPGNRLEKLVGNRMGQWSIRVNNQWRICFVWTGEGPAEVEVVDYH